MRIYFFIAILFLRSATLLAQKPLSINDFEGKLVILDFWATWCGSCLHAMPKMDSLQSEFKDQLKILLVNSKSIRDDLSKVRLFSANGKSAQRISLNCSL